MPTGFSAPAGFAERGRVLGGNALGTLSMVTWAAGFPASEILLATWDPLVLITARLVFAVVPLLVLWVLLDGPRTALHVNWGRGALVGGVGFGMGAYLMLWAQWATDPVTVVIIASLSPVAGALLEVMFDGRRLRIWFVTGLSVCIAGGVLATGAGGGSASLGWGAAAAAGSVLLFSWGSRAAVHGFPGVSALGRTTITLAGALLANGVICAVALWGGQVELPSAPIDAHQIVMLAIYAVAAMALSQLLWIASVGRLGVAVATFHMNIAPFYVMLFMLALGAAWNWDQAMGAAIVVLGVVIAQRNPVARIPAMAVLPKE